MGYLVQRWDRPASGRPTSRTTPLIAAFGLTSFACAADPPSSTADIVFLNGVVRTMDDAGPLAEAVAVRGGRIVYVGHDAGARERVGPLTEVVDLEGRLLLPGFHDTHVHPVSSGVEEGRCNLVDAASRADLERRVRACAERALAGAWVIGAGFQSTYFQDGAPSREVLDRLVPNHPAYITDAPNHAAWVNSRALALAGVENQTPDPLDGVIVRNADGSPQGTLREAAMDLVARYVPPPSDAELRAGLDRALALAASLGVTTMHEANADEPMIRAYAEAEREGWLTARVLIAVRTDPARGGSQVHAIGEIRDRYPGRRARVAAAKVILDGVIEGGTAAVLEPYVDHPESNGELRVPTVDTLASLVSTLDSAGFKVHVHAIGDRAVRAALDALERQHARDEGSGPRHILAHLQLIDPADVDRMGRLGVVASFQPLWAYRDSYIRDLTEPRLGPERSGRLYPMESVRLGGAIVAAGSDWNVTSMNPLDAIEVAITRRDPNAAEGEAWIPAERLSLLDAVRAYTVNGALAGDLESETGVIRAGLSADLVVLERDIFAIDPTEISDVLVDVTMLEGEVVYWRTGG